MAASSYNTVVQQLYVAYFGRPADPEGLGNFTAALNSLNAPTTIAGLTAAYATSASIRTLVDSFGTSAESTSLYTGGTLAFVNSIYTNVLNRTADVSGLLFWATAIDNGTLSKANAALSIMSAALTNTSAQGLLDAQTVNNKITVASNFTTNIDTTSELLAYSGNSAAATARNMLATVTSSTDTTVFQTTVTSTLNTLVTATTTNGSTFTLTTSNDSVTGTSGNDTFDGSLTPATQQTFGSADSLDGGNGNDILNIVRNQSGTVTPASVKNIETVNITVGSIANTNTAAVVTLGADNITGVTSWINDSSTGTLTINKIASLGALTVRNTSGASTFQFLDSAAAGTTDNLAVTLTTASGGVTVSKTSGSNAVETVTVAATGGDSTTGLTLTGLNTTKLVVTGESNWNGGVTSADGTLKNIDASAATGNITISAVTAGGTMTGGSGNDSLTGTSGNDTISGGAGNDTLLANGGGNDSLDGGAGNDTIKMTSTLNSSDTVAGGSGTDVIWADGTVADSAFTNVTGVETIKEDGAGLTLTLGSFAQATGITTVDLTTGNADTVTVGSGFTSALTISDAGGNTSNKIDNSGANVALTVTANVANFNGGTVTIVGGTGTDALTLTADAGTATLTNVSNLDTITINANATDATKTASVVLNADTVIAATKTLTVDASALTNASATFTYDGSAVSTATKAQNVTGGAGNDVISGGAGNDVIAGGSGNDSITSGTGNDSLSGGTGDDKFSFAVATSLDTNDTIVGGSGTDKIALGDNSAIADAAFTNVTTVETLSNDGTNGIAVTLGSAAAAAGITTVDVSAATAVSTVTVGAGFSSALTINANAQTSKLDASAYTGALTVKTAAGIAAGVGAATVTGGTGTSDTLIFDVSTAARTQAADANITAIETYKTSGANSFTITLADANAASGATLTIDGSSLTAAANVLTVDAHSETNGKVVVIGGAGNDVITVSQSSNGDNLSGGAGNDTFALTAASDLTSADTVAGGSGTDKITLGTVAAVADSAFTNVTGVETLSTDGTNAINVTLGSAAMAAGITTVNTVVAAASTVTVGSGFTSALGITVNNQTSKLDASAYTGALTVTSANAAGIGAATLTGGTGTSDTLQFDLTTLGASAAQASNANITAIETLKTVGDQSFKVTLADANTAAGKTLTVDGSSLGSTHVLTVDASAESNGKIIVTGGAGNDVITGSASIYGDSLTGGSGNDVFVFAGANVNSLDTISGGSGTDAIGLSDNTAVADSAFAAMTSVETINTNAGANGVNVVLGANAALAGITKVDLTAATAVSTVTVGSGFTNTLELDVNAQTSKLDASGYTGSLTAITAAATGIGAATLTGGTGTDTLKFDLTTLGASAAQASNANLTAVENLTTIGNFDFKITLADANVAAGKTMTIDTTSLTSGATTIVGTSEADGTLVINAGNGTNTIDTGATGSTITYTGGSGADTVTSHGANGTVNLGAGANAMVFATTGTITATGGAGVDTYTVVAKTLGGLLFDAVTNAATSDVINTADKGTEAWANASAANSKITLSSLATFSDYLNSAVRLGGDSSTNGHYAWFVYQGNTYVVESINDHSTVTSTFTDGSDVVVQLNGTLNLTGSTVGDHIVTLAVS